MKRINLVGNIYGKLTVKAFDKSEKGVLFWKCLCECGREIIVKSNSLRSGNTKSCGICVRRKNELNKIYGKLTVKEFIKTNKITTFWKCLCECGREIITSGNSLRVGHAKSCGICVRKKTQPEKIYEIAYKRYKNYAKKMSIPFEIEYKDFIIMVDNNCNYCGKLPYDVHFAYARRRYSEGINNDTYAIFNGLDKIIPEKGYTINNIVPCCKRCNSMKSNDTQENFLQKVKDIYEHKISNNTNNNKFV